MESEYGGELKVCDEEQLETCHSHHCCN